MEIHAASKRLYGVRPVCLSVAAAMLAIVTCTALAQAQPLVPVGNEFQINTYYTSAQRFPSVDTDAAGNFVVSWTDASGAYDEVYAQRYAADGTPLGGEFQVTTTPYYSQYESRLGREDNGDFAVVWTSFAQDGDGAGVFGQRFDASGTPIGGEFQVNAANYGDQYRADIAMDADGDFVVVWSTYDYYAFPQATVSGRRYNNQGDDLGNFSIPLGESNGNAVVASDDAGNFVVVWDAFDGTPDTDVLAQRYSSNAVPQGGRFQVNSYTTSDQFAPQVAMDGNGNFVVVWSSSGQDGDSTGVFGQMFTPLGVAAGKEFQVNTYTVGPQAVPVVAVDRSGDGFVVTWDTATPGHQRDAMVQRFGFDGFRDGPEFRINAFRAGHQEFPVLAAAPTHDFIATWHSENQDGDNLGAFGRRLGDPDGLIGDFGSVGLWRYDTAWVNLTPWDAIELEQWNNKVAVAFSLNRGIWTYEGAGWTQLAGWTPYLMRQVGDQLGVAFDAGRGVYSYHDGSWTQRTPWEPEVLDRLNNDLIADFGMFRGIYSLSFQTEAWTRLTSWNPYAMQSFDGRLAAAFDSGRGIWLYDSTAGWQQVTNWEPAILGSWGKRLLAGFDAGRGLHTYDPAGGWQQLTNWLPYQLTMWNGKVVAAFDSGRGIYSYDPVGGWQQLTNWEPLHMEVVDGKLAAQFGQGRGLYRYDVGSGWVKISSDVSEEIEAAALN